MKNIRFRLDCLCHRTLDLKNNKITFTEKREGKKKNISLAKKNESWLSL